MRKWVCKYEDRKNKLISRVRPARHVRRGTPGGPLSTSGPRGIFSATLAATLGPAAVTIPNALCACSNRTKSLLGGARTPQAALVSPALHHRRLKIMLKLHRRAKKSDLTIFSLLWGGHPFLQAQIICLADKYTKRGHNAHKIEYQMSCGPAKWSP